MHLNTSIIFGSVLLAISLVGCRSSCQGDCNTPTKVTAPAATTKAVCGPGSNPETGMQGRVSREDHTSGRAARGYNCNTEVVGHFLSSPTANPNGTIGGFKVLRYVDHAGHECAYYDSTLLFPSNAADGTTGVMVLDMTNPVTPVLANRLVTLAMDSPHESLVLSQERGILVADVGNPAQAPGYVDVYNLEPDCRNPTLVLSAAVPGAFGHESGLSPDGNTFFLATPGAAPLTAINLTDLNLNPIVPSVVSPPVLWSGNYTSHGLTINASGSRAYLSESNNEGIRILDISQITSRTPSPQVPEISALSWPEKTIPQNVYRFTRNGKPYLMEIDEYSADANGAVTAHGIRVGAARIIDIADETRPRVISNMRLEVHQPENRAAIANDPGAVLPVQGYAGHYCSIPSEVDPDIVACSMIVSGLRIFDIRDPANPKEVAYFNAPVKPRLTPGFEASNWAMSAPAFVPARKEIWYTDGFQGFYAIRVTNGVW